MLCDNMMSFTTFIPPYCVTLPITKALSLVTDDS